ncbi:MAG: YkgJ family cysteine cluster protein [Gammaproteobacteria bacterium]
MEIREPSCRQPASRRQSRCLPRCGACCIAPSISSPMPKMPFGKPAGERCAHLTPSQACELFGRPERPAVCSGLQASREMCGSSREHAMFWLARLERLTAPA